MKTKKKHPKGASREASAVLSCPFRFICTRNASERLNTDVLTTMVLYHSLSRGNCPSMRARAGKAYIPQRSVIRHWDCNQHVSNTSCLLNVKKKKKNPAALPNQVVYFQ